MTDTTPLPIIYSTGVDSSTTTRTTSITTPVTIASTGSDSLILNISEDAYLGDANFTITVNGVQYGGTLTATALEDQKAGQNFIIQGNFPPGPLNVAVDFLNDAFAVYSDGSLAGDRNLYVNSISINGVATTENGYQNLDGTRTYTVTAPSLSTSPNVPTVSISSQVLTKDTGVSATDLISSDGAITLKGLVTGAAGTTVKILNGTTVLGSAVISNNSWSYSETLPAGSYKLSAVATDPSGHTASTAAEPTVLIETAIPSVTITSPTQQANSSLISLSGTVAGATGTAVKIMNGGAALGMATIANGSWTFSIALAAGSYQFSAVATDLAGNTKTASDPAFTVVQAAPAVAITAQILADDTGVSSSDNITSDGAVTLKGSVTGASGTVVEILNGSTVLGDATIASGSWTYATTLAAGSYSLNAVAIDPAGDRSSTPAEPTIVVQTAAPSISIAAPVQSAGSTAFTLTGTVSGLGGTTVEIYNGTAAIGAAVISNGSWSFSDDLGAGTFSLTAKATDPAGNTAAASDAAATITSPATAGPSGVMSTTAFLDTLGVDTHMAYTDGEYADVSLVIADLKYLGISQVRDGISNGVDANGNYNGSAPLSTYIEMAQAGIKFTFIVEPTSPAVIATALGLINQVEAAVPGSVTAIEGPNEINNQPITYGTLTGEPAALAAQAALYAAVKADAVLAGVPVDYFTGYGAGSDAQGPDPTTTPGLANYDTQHPYPNFGQAPAFWVARSTALSNLTAADVATAPAVYTETGYSTGQVTPYVQEVYELDLVMDTANENITKTYLYDLLDAYAPGSPQGDDGWGLFDYTTAAKPVATALHNLTSILTDNGATAASFATTKLNYSLSGLPSDGNSMVLEKSDGTYELVVWAEPEIYNVNTDVYTAAAAQSVTVSLAQSYSSIEVFDPTTGTAAVASYANTNSVTVAVTDHPLIIQLDGATSTAQATPTVSITAQTLASDTGASATDGVTSNGAVTLTGKVSGPSGTVVAVLDGTKLLGDATISGSTWRFATTLGAGAHSLSATASDSAGSTTTAAEPTITVETTAPAVTIATPVQTANSATVTLSGTVGASGASVEVLNGTAVLGQATISNGTWNYTASLAAGSYVLSAVATDLAGNTATASDPAFTVAGVSSTGSVTGANALVTYNWNPTVQLAGYLAAVAKVAAGGAGASAIIETFGDSTTEGVNADDVGGVGALNLSYPADLTRDLQTDSGVATQNANFQGEDVDDGALSFLGSGFNSSTAYSGVFVAGGNAITTTAAGQGVQWTLAAPVTANEVTLNYLDSGNGSVTVQATGAAGTTTKTLALGNSGNMASQTIALPLGAYSGVSIIANNANTNFIEGASFTDTANPSIQLYNSGAGGAWSSSAGTGALTGSGEFPGGLAFKPNLALLDYGINDIVNQVLTPAQTVANFATMIAESRAVGADPVIVIPNPFGLNPYLTTPQITTLAAVTTGLQALAVQQNVGIIDLNATYGASPATLEADGLLDSPHPEGALYADIAARIAALLTNDASATFPTTASYVVNGAQTVSGTAGDDILFGTSTSNTLIGNGGSDSYVVNANDIADTIQNGSTASAAAGQIDFTAATHNQLWFSDSGNNLMIQILGTAKTIVVDNWVTSGAAQVAEIVASDGYKIDSGLQSLVQAMASFSTANASFNPQTTASTSLASSAFATLATAVQADWHR